MAGKQLRFVVDGDLVYGMANSTTPFVGKVGDAVGARTKEIAGGMAAASGSNKAGKRKCKLTINGKPVATTESIASNDGPVPIQARPLTHTKSILLNGKPLLLHGGTFMASPDGTLQSLSVNQMVAFGPGLSLPAGGESEAPSQTPDGASGPGGGGVTRSNYDTPSAEHVMLSRCSSARLADLLPPEYAVLVGDPVDVSTGAVVTGAVDDSRESPELAFERHYASNRIDRDGPLGHGWSHNFEQAIWLEHGRVVLFDGGRELEFDCFTLPDQVARAGDVLTDLTGRLQLRSHGHNTWELIDEFSIRHFVPVPGTSSRDRDRGFAQLSTIVRRDRPLIELTYDDRARLERVAVDGSSIFSLRYDTEDRLITLNGGVARYDYSGEGDLIEVANLEGSTRKYAYESHLLVRETNRRGGEFFYGYDAREGRARCVRTWGTGGRLDRVLAYESGATLVTDSLGHRTIFTLSPMGLVTGREDAEGRVTSFRYDAQLRLTEIAFPDGTKAVDLYDDAGRLVKHRERGGATWRMVYDTASGDAAEGGLPRLVEGFDPQQGRWQFGYDLAGRLTRVEDPLGHTTTLEYDQARLCRIIDPLGRVTQLRLGAHDEPHALQPPTGCAVAYEYDEQGRLTTARPDVSEEARWHYDVYGRLVGVRCGSASVQLTRDEEGGVTSLTTPNDAEYQRRGPFGLLLGARQGDLDLGYQYDSEGRLIAASRDGRPRVEFQRDALGLVAAYVIDRETEGAVRRSPKTARVEGVDEGDLRIDVAWDHAGRIVSFDAGAGLRTFEYRDDGLMTRYATPEHDCAIERDPLGVVVGQVVGDFGVQSPHVDHRGDRYGVDAGSISVSYLWASDGQLERAAISADEPFDIEFGLSADGCRGRARHADADVDYSVRQRGTAVASNPAVGDRDALGRPLQSSDGKALIWDEDRLLLEGERLVVCDPRCDQRVATIDGAALQFVDVDAEPPSPELCPRDAALEACRLAGDGRDDEDLGGAEGWTPRAMLECVFKRRVWDPVANPLGPNAPWNPDGWRIHDRSPQAPRFRLDAETVMRLLSPFPRAKLRLPESG